MLNINQEGNGITVNNSIVYFTIRNCTVYNSSAGINDAGILLVNVSNALITQSNSSYNLGNGICLVNSTNNEISDNTASHNGRHGIKLHDSDNNQILNNDKTFDTYNRCTYYIW